MRPSVYHGFLARTPPMLFALVLCAISAVGTQEDRCAPKAPREVAAQASARIVVDADGEVLFFPPSAPGNVKPPRPLGYEARRDPDLPPAIKLPAQQAVLNIRKLDRWSCGWRLWFVLSAGFDPARAGAQDVSYSVLIFRETGKGVETTLEKKFLDVSEFLLEDVNGDAQKEFAVQHASESLTFSTTLDLWQIDVAGKLLPVDLANVREGLFSNSSIAFANLSTEPALITEQRDSLTNGWMITRKSYKWDRATLRYRLDSKSVIEETLVQ